MPTPPSPWILRDIRATMEGGTSRVEASLNGTPLWFESESVILDPLPEAFAAALLIPVLDAGVLLEIEGVLDSRWVANTQRVIDTYASWWNVPAQNPLRPAGLVVRPPVQSSARAQCFTGGVDSFYTLLHESEHQTTHLFFVEGYDIDLLAYAQRSATEALLREVAEARGLGLLLLRSNLRQLPEFSVSEWGTRSHGGALAAAALVCSSAVDRLVIPSSYAYTFGRPWGTHWDLDPWWSLPGRLDIVHGDAPRRRDKVAAIAAEPDVQNHLRVCWKPEAPPGGNCSSCEKCVRTMASLAIAGHLHKFSRFDTDTPLAERIDRLPTVSHTLWDVWADLGRRSPDRAVRRSVFRLLLRSRWQSTIHATRQRLRPRTRMLQVRAAVARRLSRH